MGENIVALLKVLIVVISAFMFIFIMQALMQALIPPPEAISCFDDVSTVAEDSVSLQVI